MASVEPLKTEKADVECGAAVKEVKVNSQSNSKSSAQGVDEEGMKGGKALAPKAEKIDFDHCQ